MRNIEEQMCKLSVAMVPEVEREELFDLQVHQTPDEFEDFCFKLVDPQMKKLVVRFFLLVIRSSI